MHECATHYNGFIWEKTCPNSGEGDVIINFDLNIHSIWVKSQLSILIVHLLASRTNLDSYI